MYILPRIFKSYRRHKKIFSAENAETLKASASLIAILNRLRDRLARRTYHTLNKLSLTKRKQCTKYLYL